MPINSQLFSADFFSWEVSWNHEEHIQTHSWKYPSTYGTETQVTPSFWFCRLVFLFKLSQGAGSSLYVYISWLHQTAEGLLKVMFAEWIRKLLKFRPDDAYAISFLIDLHLKLVLSEIALFTTETRCIVLLSTFCVHILNGVSYSVLIYIHVPRKAMWIESHNK